MTVDENEQAMLLGKSTDYVFDYAPELLFPIAREQGRAALPVDASLMRGVDRWTAYELSWLNDQGIPQTAIAEFDFACQATHIVESKSFKLYLNSLNMTRFSSEDDLLKTLEVDLGRACGGALNIQLFHPDNYPVVTPSDYVCIDACIDGSDRDVVIYEPQASLIESKPSKGQHRYVSHVFRSLCPVTGQPDWASIYITIEGCELSSQALLAYLVSFRQHQGFHEQCIEQIYADIYVACEPNALSVYGRFLRRGGLDINPYRSNRSEPVPNIRQARQ